MGLRGARRVCTEGRASPRCRQWGARETRRQELVDVQARECATAQSTLSVVYGPWKRAAGLPGRPGSVPIGYTALDKGRDPGKPKCVVCKITAVTGMAKGSTADLRWSCVRRLERHKCSQTLLLFPFVSRQTHAHMHVHTRV